MMRSDDREICRNSKDIAHGPRLEEIERDVEMVLEQGLECDEPLLNFLRGVPVGCLLRAGIGPALEELFHSIDALTGFVVCGVDDVVEEELGDEAEELWEEDGRDSWRGCAHCECLLRLAGVGMRKASEAAVVRQHVAGALRHVSRALSHRVWDRTQEVRVTVSFESRSCCHPSSSVRTCIVHHVAMLSQYFRSSHFTTAA